MVRVITADSGVPFPFDPDRTAIVQSYNVQDFIADEVLLDVPVGKELFEYKRFKIEDSFTVPELEFGRKDRPRKVEFEAEEVQDKTKNYGLEDDVPETDRDAAMPTMGEMQRQQLDPADRASIQLRHLLALGKELRTSQLVFDPDSYADGYKYTFPDGDRLDGMDADPWPILNEAMDVPLQRPDSIVFGQLVWTKLSTNKFIRAATGLAGTESGIATPEGVARILRVRRVLIGQSRFNSAAEGLDMDLTRAWGNHIAFIYQGGLEMRQSAGVDMNSPADMVLDPNYPTFGFRAVYQEPRVYSRMNEAPGLKGVEEVQVKEGCKEVICGSQFGFLLSNVVDPAVTIFR